jgi:hypothetical protein
MSLSPTVRPPTTAVALMSFFSSSRNTQRRWTWTVWQPPRRRKRGRQRRPFGAAAASDEPDRSAVGPLSVEDQLLVAETGLCRPKGAATAARDGARPRPRGRYGAAGGPRLPLTRDGRDRRRCGCGRQRSATTAPASSADSSRLESVDVRRNGLSTEGMQSLLDAFRPCQTVKEVLVDEKTMPPDIANAFRTEAEARKAPPPPTAAVVSPPPPPPPSPPTSSAAPVSAAAAAAAPPQPPTAVAPTPDGGSAAAQHPLLRLRCGRRNDGRPCAPPCRSRGTRRDASDTSMRWAA